MSVAECWLSVEKPVETSPDDLSLPPSISLSLSPSRDMEERKSLSACVGEPPKEAAPAERSICRVVKERERDKEREGGRVSGMERER